VRVVDRWNSASWLVVVLVVASVLVLYRRIGREEVMMIAQFGDEYRAYMQRTGRLLPRFIHKHKTHKHKTHKRKSDEVQS